MKIAMRDGQVFQGTGVQIVRAMRDVAFSPSDFTLPEYVAWVVAKARELDDVELDVKGETEEELAGALVREMVRAELTRRL